MLRIISKGITWLCEACKVSDLMNEVLKHVYKLIWVKWFLYARCAQIYTHTQINVWTQVK